MKGLLADVNVQGQMEVLRILLEGKIWGEVWKSLGLSILTFAEVGLDRQSADDVVWRLCQSEQLVLLTANRNEDGPTSLEATLRNEGQTNSLPVFTLANSEAVRHSRVYAERVVERLLEYVLEIDQVRGTGRIYLP